MSKNIYIVLITIVALYFAYKDQKKSDLSKNFASEDSVSIMDSAMILEMEKNADSLSKSLITSDKSVSTKIQKAATTIVALKNEVTDLKGIIKEKDKQINELKTTINDFTTSINSKFRIFAVDSQDRK